jgi:hypothetical protein
MIAAGDPAETRLVKAAASTAWTPDSMTLFRGQRLVLELMERDLLLASGLPVLEGWISGSAKRWLSVARVYA